jgi:hypothetical protein
LLCITHTHIHINTLAGEHLEILELLVAGYESSDPESGMVVNSDRMLRACVRHNELCEHFLFNKQVRSCIHTCIHTFMHKYILTFIHIHVFTYMYIHTFTHTNPLSLTHTQTQTHAQFVDKFFALIEEPNFAVSGAVFNTFRFIMSPQNAVGVAYINENFDYFFAKFTVLCKSENLIIKTECFEILGV